MIHQLKIESCFFAEMVEGRKTFEVRKNDRDFHEGDYLGLNEITLHSCNEAGEHKETGNFMLVKVLNVFKDYRFVKDGYVIMSIRPCSIKEVEWDYAPWYTELSEKTGYYQKD